MRGQNFLDWEGVGSISHKHFFCNISVFPVPLLSETVASWAFFEWSFWGTVLENINKKRLFPSNGVWKKNTPDSQKQKPLMVWLHMYIYIYIYVKLIDMIYIHIILSGWYEYVCFRGTKSYNKLRTFLGCFARNPPPRHRHGRRAAMTLTSCGQVLMMMMYSDIRKKNLPGKLTCPLKIDCWNVFRIKIVLF